MRTLTDVFASGAPSLPEGLRTLVVSPAGAREPGTMVRAVFTLYNAGDAPATGMRVRFRVSHGLQYVRDSARVDDRVLEDAGGETQLTQAAGAGVGEVGPGDERRVAAAFVLTRAALRTAALELQAAVFARETGIVGSNVVRLTARMPLPYDTIVMMPIAGPPAFAANLPSGAHPLSASAIAPAREPLVADGRAEIRIRVANAADATARDVRVQLEIGAAARIEAVEGATRVGTMLMLGDVHAHALASVAVRLLLARPVPEGAIAIGARVEAVGSPALTLTPLTIPAGGAGGDASAAG